jgi:hypothetical protein
LVRFPLVVKFLPRKQSLTDELSEEMATKNAKNHKERYMLTYLRIHNQSCYSFRVSLRRFVATALLPSTFLVRHSSVPWGGWTHRLVDVFAALGILWSY